MLDVFSYIRVLESSNTLNCQLNMSGSMIIVCNVIFSGMYMSTIRKSLGKNGSLSKIRRIQPFNSAINCIRMVILKDLLVLPIYLPQVNLQLLVVTRILILRKILPDQQLDSHLHDKSDQAPGISILDYACLFC